MLTTEDATSVEEVHEPTAAGRSVMVYRYGLLAPTEGRELVLDQMLLAHRYRNTLTEIERGRRAAQRALLSELGLEAHEESARAAGAELKAARDALKRARAKAAYERRDGTRAREDKPDLSSAIERVAEAKRSNGAALDALREARAALRSGGSVRVRLDQINDLANELVKNARAYSGLARRGPHVGAFGTYQLVEDAMSSAKKAPLYDGTEPVAPRFVRAGTSEIRPNVDGRVSVQINGGLSVDDAWACTDSQLRIETVPDRNRPRGPSRFAVLHMRVESAPDRSPVWARWPMRVHRPLPSGALIKRATVRLRHHGRREEWVLELTVEVPSHARTRTAGNGVAAIDLGWRAVPDGVRIATWATETETGTCVIPHRLLTGLDLPARLRAVRDKNFNEARAELLWHLQVLPDMPEWLARDTEYLDMWRSANRLHALALRWRARRFAGDDTAFMRLETWRYHDHHLMQWEADEWASSRRARKDLYRRFARDIADKFETVVFEDFDLASFAEGKPAEYGPKGQPSGASYMRQMAAVGDFRLLVEQAVRLRRGTVGYVDAVDSTRECHVCGHKDAWRASAMIHHACSACGAVWDQDENACHVLRERWRDAVASGTARNAPRSRKTQDTNESRWARAARLKSEKEARKEALANGDVVPPNDS